MEIKIVEKDPYLSKDRRRYPFNVYINGQLLNKVRRFAVDLDSKNAQTGLRYTVEFEDGNWIPDNEDCITPSERNEKWAEYVDCVVSSLLSGLSSVPSTIRIGRKSFVLVPEEQKDQ